MVGHQIGIAGKGPFIAEPDRQIEPGNRARAKGRGRLRERVLPRKPSEQGSAVVHRPVDSCVALVPVLHLLRLSALVVGQTWTIRKRVGLNEAAGDRVESGGWNQPARKRRAHVAAGGAGLWAHGKWGEDVPHLA